MVEVAIKEVSDARFVGDQPAARSRLGGDACGRSAKVDARTGAYTRLACCQAMDLAIGARLELQAWMGVRQLRALYSYYWAGGVCGAFVDIFRGGEAKKQG